jgi:hypothetical protein
MATDREPDTEKRAMLLGLVCGMAVDSGYTPAQLIADFKPKNIREGFRIVKEGDARRNALKALEALKP